jgi:hypothetical protein
MVSKGPYKEAVSVMCVLNNDDQLLNLPQSTQVGERARGVFRPGAQHICRL